MVSTNSSLSSSNILFIRSVTIVKKIVASGV